jgi:ferredoxin
MRSRAFIAYLSPAGTTRQVARGIEETILELGIEVNTLDLGISRRQTAFRDLIASMEAGDCLFVGSAVYRDIAVPPLMEFIKALPEVREGAAVPFVTWGAVTSGVALWQMGRVLQEKGFALVGAAAVVAEHCMMWRSEAPSGAGRPHGDDLQKVEAMTREIFGRLRTGRKSPIDLADLDYQSDHHAREMKENIEKPWMIVPKTVDETKCTQCGICAEQCPVGAVALDPLPVFAGTCFDCFNCVRLCPEGAIDTPLSAERIENHIAKLKEKYGEAAETKIFMT